MYLIILRREVPESGVMLKPMISDIFSQCRCRRPGLHRMWTTGRCSWGEVEGGGREGGREGGRGEEFKGKANNACKLANHGNFN